MQAQHQLQEAQATVKRLEVNGPLPHELLPQAVKLGETTVVYTGTAIVAVGIHALDP